MKNFVASLLISTSIATTSHFANAESGGEELWAIEKSERAVTQPPVSKAVGKSSNAGKPRAPVGGNLPPEFSRRGSLAQVSLVTVLPSNNLKEVLQKLKLGSDVDIKIDHSIIAFADERAPVIGTIESGPLTHWRVIGESRLEQNSKRIFIEFTMIARDGRAFKFRGSALTSDGQPGFVGEHHSSEGALFAGEFVSSVVGAYFDGLVPRQTNVYGQVQTDNSVDSAVKKGLSAGAMSSAERFKEKLKRTPEFSEVKGPLRARLLVLERGTGI